MPEAITTTPVVIKVGGSPFSEGAMNNLALVTVESTLGSPDSATIILNDQDYAIIDDAKFKIGAEIQVTFNGENKPIFDGEIVLLEPVFGRDFGTQLVITAYDKRHRLTRGTNYRSFLKSKDSEAISKILGEAGLSGDIPSTPTVHDHIFQDNMSDYDFIKMLAARNGLQMWMEDKSKVKMVSQDSKRSTVNLVYVTDGDDGLKELNIRLSGAGQVNEVLVSSWDPVTQKQILGKAKNGKSATSIGAGAAGKMADSAFSSATYKAIALDAVDQKQADDIAKSKLVSINDNAIEAEGVAVGNPKILAGASLKITNLGTRFSGEYRVTHARHYLSNNIYETEFRCEGNNPKTLGTMLAGGSESAVNGGTASQYHTGIYPAIVTNVEDPDKLGRIKVKYPWLDDKLESDWARMVHIGAGGKRGLQWIPEVNDEVAVIFQQGNLNKPYIVGSLFSTKYKSATTDKYVGPHLSSMDGHVIAIEDKDKASNETGIKLFTAGAFSIHLDEKGKKIIITTPQKEIITLEDGKGITIDGAKGKIDIKATGNVTVDTKGNATVKSTGNANIEATGNATVKATGNLNVDGMMVTVKAKTGLTLDGGAMVTIKGGIVKIN